MPRISAYDDWLYKSAENEMEEEEIEMTEEQLKVEEIDGCFEILGNHSDIHVQTESLKIYKYVQELKKNNKELNDFRNSEVSKLLVKVKKLEERVAEFENLELQYKIVFDARERMEKHISELEHRLSKVDEDFFEELKARENGD